MATSVPSNSQQRNDPSEKIAQQFLSTADDYFRSEIKCMFSSFFFSFVYYDLQNFSILFDC
jgi:hypothetical protein